MLLALVLVAAQASAPITYHTQIHTRYEAVGTSGTLKLWYSPGGDVHGAYTPDDGDAFSSSVHGVLDGKKITLDFTALDGLHIEGTIDHGTIQGFGDKREDDQLWLLTAIPERANAQGDTPHDSSSSTSG